MRKIFAITATLLLIAALAISGAAAQENRHNHDGTWADNYLADPEVEGMSMGMPAGIDYPRNPAVVYADPTPESPYYHSGIIWTSHPNINMRMGDELEVKWTPTGTGHTAPTKYVYTPGIVYIGSYPMYTIDNFWYNEEYLVLYYDGYGYPIGVSPSHKVYYFGPEVSEYDPAYASLIDWLNNNIGYVSISYVPNPPFTIGYPSTKITSSSYYTSSGVVLR